MKQQCLKKTLAIAGLTGSMLLGAFSGYSQAAASSVSLKSNYKETLKKVEGVKDVYYQDKFSVNASIDVSQLSGFLDNLTNSNAENVSVSIAVDRSIFNQYWLKNSANGQFTNGEAVGDDGLNIFEPFITLADIDNDGFLDAVVNDFFKDKTIWLKNDGTGKFSNDSFTITESLNDVLAIGDLNGDGWKDAFILNYGDESENAVFLNDGKGGFIDSGQRLGTANSSNLRLGDLNGDGALDAFVTNYGTNAVWLNNGLGAFEATGQILGKGNFENVVLADIDKNGSLDAYVANQGGNIIFLNTGNGSFNTAPSTLGAQATYGLGVGDFNGDGWLDLVDGNIKEGENCMLWLNNGTGDSTFSEGPALELQGDAIGVADFNKDGKQDLFIGGGPVTSYLLNGNGNGSFNQAQTFDDVETNASIIPLGDLNNDSWIDIFVSNKVYLYEGSEIFTFEDTLDYAQKGEDEEKFNLLKIKDGVSGVAKFVTAEDVSLGDKPKYKKTLSVMVKWNAKKLVVSIKGTPTLDSNENILDLQDDLDALKANVSEVNKKAVKKLTEADKRITNFIIFFNNHSWSVQSIPYTGTEAAKFSQYKDDGTLYTEKLGNWNIKSGKTALEYLGETKDIE